MEGNTDEEHEALMAGALESLPHYDEWKTRTPADDDCLTCSDAGCDGEGFIPGTTEECCECPHHGDPQETLRVRGDMLYDEMRDRGL